MLKSDIKVVIKNYEESINAYRWILDIINREPANFKELVFQKYIEFSRGTDVAAYLNKEGYRLPGSIKAERQYISTDITNLMWNNDSRACVNPVLYEVALHISNSKYKTWEDKIIAMYKKFNEF